MRRVCFLLLTASISLTSCIDILEDIILNRNGSGQYSYTIDMSGIFENEMTKNMLKGGDNTGNMMQDMDSTVYGKDLPVAEKADNPALWDKVTTRLTVNEATKKYIISIQMPFNNTADIDYLLKNMGKAMGKTDTSAASVTKGFSEGMNPVVVHYILGKKTITRQTDPAANNENKDLEMAKMFLADASYRVVYHLPGKVKKTSIEGATVKGKTVETSMPLADMLDGKIKLDGSIRYK